MPPRFRPPDGWVVQAFSFAIDPTDEQLAIIARFFGARRKAYNWALEQIKAGIDAYHATGVYYERPSLYGLRKRWNAEKSAICVNTETGETWWPEVSKEVFADGIRGAVDAYWRWQGSRAGTIAGRRVGFPATRSAARTGTAARSRPGPCAWNTTGVTSASRGFGGSARTRTLARSNAS
jgi:putative transposase